MNEPLTQEEIADLADRWYKALDVHAPVEELFTMLLDDGNVMDWPKAPPTATQSSGTAGTSV